MQFNEYQKLAGETDLEHPLNYYFLGLTEEAGEVAGLRKRYLRDEGNTDYDKMTKELGDVMWYVARLADRYNLKLDDIASENITKLQDRKQRGVICGVGDNR